MAEAIRGTDADELGSGGASPSRIAWAAIVVGLLLLTVVSIPRFAYSRDIDPQDIALTDQPNGWFMDHDRGTDLGRYSFDTYAYVASVQYYRGEFDRYPIFGPWRWRLVPSWIAAKTPIENPTVAFAAVSFGFLAVGLVALVSAAARSRIQRRGQFLVAGLYALSFPAFWYGTSGYIDGSTMAMLCVGLALIHWRRWALFLLLLPIGMIVKETFIVIVPVATAYLWARAGRRRDWLAPAAAFFTVALGAYAIARWALPTPRTLDWLPRWSRLGWNLSRPQALGSFVLTCGIAVPLACFESWQLFRRRNLDAAASIAWREDAHLVVGLVFGFLVAMHGFLTAYADGRHGWVMYPFAILLSVRWIEAWLDRRRVSSPSDSSPTSPSTTV